MKKPAYIIIFIFLFILACKNESISFIELTPFNTTDTVFSENKQYTTRKVIYLVNGFMDSDRNLQSIDSIAQVTAKPNAQNYSSFIIIFYKSSDITNVENLRKSPRDIDRYSEDNDMVYTYEWNNGSFVGRRRVNN